MIVYMILPELSRRARQLGWASYLVSTGRETLAGRTTFSQINTLARPPGKTHGVPSVLASVAWRSSQSGKAKKRAR